MSQEPITTYCPACAKSFRVPPDLNGKKILCKSCQTHFMVQADRPGLPAAPPPPPARPNAPGPAQPHAAPATSHHATTQSQQTAGFKAPSAPPSSTPVTAASSAPVAVPPPPTDELAPIPFDNIPFTQQTGPPSAPIVKQDVDKAKVDGKGPYCVAKLVGAGKLSLENMLNEHAADGWRLEQIVTLGHDSMAIFSRFGPPPAKPPE